MSSIDHEELWAIYLNSGNGLIQQEMLTRGTLTSTPIDSRTILRHCLMANAAGVIIVHNHPSGTSQPSLSDVKQTERVQQACKLMDINLVDHLILCQDTYFSFSDENISHYKSNNINV